MESEKDAFLISGGNNGMNVAEEPEEGLIRRAFNSGCKGRMVSKEQDALSHQPHNDAHPDVKAEPATHETTRHLMTCDNIRAEPTAHQKTLALQHTLCENIRAEPTAQQKTLVLQHTLCENIKAEPPEIPPNSPCVQTKSKRTAFSVEESDDWEDVEGLTVKFEPDAYTCPSSLQQVTQASSPSPVRLEGKDVTDCCEAEAALEPASAKKQATSEPGSSDSESPQRPSPATLQAQGNSSPTPVSLVIPLMGQLCPSAFLQSSTHVTVHHSQKLLTEPSARECGRGRPSAGNSEQKVDPARRYVCDVCCKAFTWRVNLKAHKMIHTGQKPFVCTVCSKCFTLAGTLKRHELIHTGQKPFVCDVCSKCFTEAGSLKRHKRTHTGQRPFICDVCSKGFTRACHLKSHRRAHTGERPFVCDVCGKAYTEAGSLKSHKLIHTGQKPFVCDVCNKGFTEAGHLKRHKQIHTRVKPFACDVCSESFTDAEKMKKHKLIHTGQ